MKQDKIAVLLGGVAFSYYASIIEQLPPEMVQIIMCWGWPPTDYLIPLQKKGYSFSYIDDVKLSDYDFFVVEDANAERFRPFFDPLKDRKHKRFLCLTHDVGGEPKSIPQAQYVIRATQSTAYPGDAMEQTITRDQNALLTDQLTALNPANKIEYAYTGPFHMGQWLKTLHEPKDKLRSELEKVVGGKIPKDKPLIAFYLDDVSDNNAIISGLNKLANFATVIYKGQPIAGEQMRQKALNKKILRYPNNRYAPNLLRFAADFILCGCCSGTLLSSMMVGLPVIPYYTQQVFLPYRDDSEAQKCSFQEIIKNSELNPYYSLNKQCWEKLGLLCDLEDTQSIVAAMQNKTFWQEYPKRLPEIQKSIFGDYTLDNPDIKTAKLILRAFKTGSFGKDTYAIQTEQELYPKIQHINSTHSIQFSRDLLLQNHLSQPLILSCLENAPDQSTVRLFSNYLKILTNRPVEFPKVHRYKKGKNSPLRVSIFTSRFDNRVNRLAYCAKAGGMKLQLLCENTSFQEYIPKELFDEIAIVNYPFKNMEKINKLMLGFGSDIVHCHAACTKTDTIFPFVFASKIPVVVDYYDLNHAQYATWPTQPKWLFDACFFFEKYAFLHADGHCMRSPYLECKDVAPLWKKESPAELLPEPIIESKCKKEKIPNTPLKIGVDGACYGTLISGRDFENIIANLFCYTDCSIYIYRCPKEYIKKYDKNRVHILPKMHYPQYMTFLQTLDAVFETASTTQISLSGYKIENHPYSSTNSFNDFIETHNVSIFHSFFKFTNYRLEKIGCGIFYTEEDLKNPDFYKKIPQKILELQNSPWKITEFSEQHLTHQLEKLYRNSIDYAINIKGEQIIN